MNGATIGAIIAAMKGGDERHIERNPVG